MQIIIDVPDALGRQLQPFQDRIAEVLALRRSLDQHCETLIDLALQQGGADNVTVMLGQYRIPRP